MGSCFEEGSRRLLEAGYAPGRLGKAGPPSRLPLAEGARSPWAVQEWVVDDVVAGVATVPGRTGDIPPYGLL